MPTAKLPPNNNRKGKNPLGIIFFIEKSIFPVKKCFILNEIVFFNFVFLIIFLKKMLQVRSQRQKKLSLTICVAGMTLK